LQEVIPGYRVRWLSGSAHSTTSNTDGWEYVNQQAAGDTEQTIKYWDYSARAYRFFGTTASAPTTTKLADRYEVSFGVDVTAATLPYYTKLWFSNGNAVVYPARQFGQPVTLQFVKPQSRVRIMFQHKDPGGDISGITLSEISFAAVSGHLVYQSGTFTACYPLTGTATTETFETVSGDSDNTVPINTQDTWYTVLPATGQGAYRLQLKVAGEPKTASVAAELMEWLPGYDYTYVFKVSSDGGVELSSVNSAFTGWQTVTQDHTVYNW